jgi:septal ring factor EnvC (AmiA/AmiB activator)
MATLNVGFSAQLESVPKAYFDWLLAPVPQSWFARRLPPRPIPRETAELIEKVMETGKKLEQLRKELNDTKKEREERRKKLDEMMMEVEELRKKLGGVDPDMFRLPPEPEKQKK